MRRSMDKKVKIKVGSFKSKLFSKSPVDETMKQDLRKRRLPTDMPTTLRTTSRGALGSVNSVAFPRSNYQAAGIGATLSGQSFFKPSSNPEEKTFDSKKLKPARNIQKIHRPTDDIAEQKERNKQEFNEMNISGQPVKALNIFPQTEASLETMEPLMPRQKTPEESKKKCLNCENMGGFIKGL